MKAILLDIEGTTTPIDFVHKTLFPYAKEKIGAFVEANFAEIQPEISQLKSEYRRDFTEQIYGRNFTEDAPESVVNYLKFLIDIDRKSTPLKSLQGKIWQKGYESGELKSEMFADVPRVFKRWKDEDITIAIFSSGSVLAQKLIFAYSNFGDLTPFISNYFDTTIGGKKESDSYKKIAEELELKTDEILFVSDVPAELDAARKSGMQTTLSVRAGNSPITEDTTHRIVENFDDLE